jgi:hypothetical protein
VNSSTSSSRAYRNIWTAIGLAAAMLGMYELGLRVLHPAPGTGTSQAQANTVRMESLAFGGKSPSVLMAGSSLTFNLKSELIDPRAVNAGLGANSVATPLEVAMASHLKPRVVLVEVGLPLLKGVNRQAIDDIERPVSHFMLGSFKSLRQGFQPVNLALSKFSGKRGKGEKSLDPAFVERTITLKLEECAVPLRPDETKTLSDVLDVIKRSIQFWEPQGTQVILVEIPGEPRVMATLRYQQVMQAVKDRFPTNRNRWVPPMPYSAWRTSDGVHLVSEDVDRYCRYLHDYLAPKIH